MNFGLAKQEIMHLCFYSQKSHQVTRHHCGLRLTECGQQMDPVFSCMNERWCVQFGGNMLQKAGDEKMVNWERVRLESCCCDGCLYIARKLELLAFAVEPLPENDATGC